MLKFLDQKEEEAFARDGYIVRQVLDQHQIDSARNEIEAWMRVQHDGWPDKLPFHDDTLTYFSALEVDPEVSGSISKRLNAIVGEAFLTNTIGAVVGQNGIAVKVTNGRAVPLHLHAPLVLAPFGRNVICWCSLADADEDSGTLFVIPRSHNLYRHIHIAGEPQFFDPYKEELVREYGVAVAVKAGEAIYFDNVLLHGSYPNQLASPRLVILANLLETGSTHVSYRRAVDGSIEVVSGLRQMMTGYSNSMKNGRNYELDDNKAILKRLPAWNRKASFEQLEILLQSDLIPSEEFDPLEYLCGPEKPVEAVHCPNRQQSISQMLKLRLRAMIREIPGAQIIRRFTLRVLGRHHHL